VLAERKKKPGEERIRHAFTFKNEKVNAGAEDVDPRERGTPQANTIGAKWKTGRVAIDHRNKRNTATSIEKRRETWCSR